MWQTVAAEVVEESEELNRLLIETEMTGLRRPVMPEHP
jgi:hypothetical protein